jgi:hypothetical protein
MSRVHVLSSQEEPFWRLWLSLSLATCPLADFDDSWKLSAMLLTAAYLPVAAMMDYTE